MKRKIIRQGHNTLTMTLPSEWVKKFNISSGDDVDVYEKDNCLLINSEKHDNNMKTEFSIDGMDLPTIWKYFMAVYREGYDEVKVKFTPGLELENPYKFFSHHQIDLKYGKNIEKKEATDVIQGVVSRFIGFEIIECGVDYVLIRELSQPTSREFDNSLRRVLLVLQQMADEILEAIKSSKPKILMHIHDIDITLDKFHDYCIRILNKVGNKESRKTTLLFSTLYLLELMGDEFKSISHHLIYDFKDQNYKSVVGITESIKEQLDLYYSMFYKFDLSKVTKMSELDMSRYFNVHDTIKKIKDEAPKEIFHHLRIITRYLNALTELRIEMEF